MGETWGEKHGDEKHGDRRDVPRLSPPDLGIIKAKTRLVCLQVFPKPDSFQT